jgi:DNA polymerase-4
LRNIIHLHVPAFQVAVERARRAELRSRPVVVGSTCSGAGRVISLSLEAFEAGVRRGMRLSKAMRYSKDIVVVDPDAQLYSYVAGKITERLFSLSPAVEPARFGHFFVDVSGTRRLFGQAVDCAVRIRRLVLDDLSLPGALGIARNKLVSSIAAKIVTPLGKICDVPPGSESEFLSPLDVCLLPSVDKVKEVLVDDLNVKLVRELASVELNRLAHIFGREGVLLYREARGIDESPVRSPRREPSVLVEETLAYDTNEDRVLLAALYRMSEQAGSALRERRVLPRRLTLYVRYADDFDAARTASLEPASDLDRTLFASVERLFYLVCSRRQCVRHISLEFAGLFPSEKQMALFSRESPGDNGSADKAVDLVRERYGPEAIRVGRML